MSDSEIRSIHAQNFVEVVTCCADRFIGSAIQARHCYFCDVIVCVISLWCL